MCAQAAKKTLDDDRLIATSVKAAGDKLGLTQDQTGAIIGASRSILTGVRASIKNKKSQQLALLLIRVYRSLYALTDGQESVMRHWIATPNKHLADTPPATLLATPQGLVEVVIYLDAMRGKI